MSEFRVMIWPEMPVGAFALVGLDRPLQGAAYIPGVGIVTIRELLEADIGMCAGYHGA